MDLDAMCELYFEEKRESGEPVLISELPFFIGYGSRHAVYDLEENPEFSNVIKKARRRLEIECERAMMADKGNPTKHIFRLKQPSVGWVDKTEHHATQDTRIQVEVVGMPQLPSSAVAVLTGQPQAIEAEVVTGSVTDADNDVVDLAITNQNN